MPDDKALKDKVVADHAKTGKPISPTEDPTDHSTSASAIAGKVDPSGKSGASVNAASVDAVNKDDEAKKAKEQQEQDNSLVGKIRRSELFLVTDHSLGGDPYVGISPQNDPKAGPASKTRSQVMPLDKVSPRTGMQVRPKTGDSFSVGDGFGPETTPSDWQKVTKPDGSLLFA